MTLVPEWQRCKACGEVICGCGGSTTDPFRGAAKLNRQPFVRRVVCAAIRAADGDVLLGIRHYDRSMHAQIHARSDGKKFSHRHDPDQGFVDQHGKYMTREEAYQVAAEAGQIAYPDRCGAGLDGPKLYSEGLY